MTTAPAFRVNPMTIGRLAALTLTFLLPALGDGGSAQARRGARHLPKGQAKVSPSPAPAAPALAARFLVPDPLVGNAEQLTLELQVEGLPGAAEPALLVQINGVTAAFSVVSRARPRSFTLRLAAPPVDCTVTATVAHAGRVAVSPPLRVLRYLAPPRPARLFGLAVGVSRYADARLDLRLAGKDAQDFAAALRRGASGLFAQAEIQVLTDEQATRAQILAALRALQQRLGDNDVAVVFLAGHGLPEPSSGRYRFLPSDADLQAVGKSGLGLEDLWPPPGPSGTRERLLLFLDSCHAGELLHTVPFAIDREGRSPAVMDREVVVFSSGAGAQAARESAQWGNGAFTRALLEGLQGQADYNHNDQVSVSELELYVGDRVRALTLGAQSPVSAKPNMVEDFAVAAVPPAAPAWPQRLPQALSLLFAAAVGALLVPTLQAWLARRRPVPTPAPVWVTVRSSSSGRQRPLQT